MPYFKIKFRIMPGSGTPKAVFHKDTALEELENAVVDEKVKDRRVIKILRKYLDLGLSENQRQVFESSDFEALGELLHDLIFNPADENLHKSFDAWYATAVNDGEGDEPYDIYLEFEREKAFDDLAMLPWEYMYYKRRDKTLLNSDPFIGANRSRRINLYRKIPFNFLGSHSREDAEIIAPLKVLFIVSESAKEGEKLNLDQKYLVLDYFRKLQEANPDKFEIRFLIQPDASTDKLTEELNLGYKEKRRFTDWKDYDSKSWEALNLHSHDAVFEPHVIHFLGHGQVLNDSSVLKMSTPNVIPDTYTSVDFKDQDFARCIQNSRLNPRLVFLHSCNGGRVVNYIEGGGTAVQLLKTGIPYVIAMQNTILETEALAFTKVFYEAFISGKDIGSCVTAGRFKLSGDGGYKQKAFGSPVLFTSSEQPLRVVSGMVSPNEDENRGTVSLMKFCVNSRCRNRGVRFEFAAHITSCPFCGEGLDSESLVKTEPKPSDPHDKVSSAARPASHYEMGSKQGNEQNVQAESALKTSKNPRDGNNWNLGR